MFDTLTEDDRDLKLRAYDLYDRMLDATHRIERNEVAKQVAAVQRDGDAYRAAATNITAAEVELWGIKEDCKVVCTELRERMSSKLRSGLGGLFATFASGSGLEDLLGGAHGGPLSEDFGDIGEQFVGVGGSGFPG